jgi:NTE family protein
MNYFDLINKTITSMTNHIAIMSIKEYPPDILIEISRESCGIFDFFKAEEMVEIGRFAASNKLNLLDE